MKKRFIIAVSKATPEEDKAFQQFIETAGVGWWHWLPTLWLLYNLEGNWEAAEIRDKVCECYPTKQVFVAELNDASGDTWAAFGPKGENRNMFSWLHRNWSKPPEHPGT